MGKRSLYADAIVAAAGIVARGEALTYRAIGAEMKCLPTLAKDAVSTARRAGRFPWEIVRAPRMTIQERAGRDKAARDRRMARIEPKYMPERLAQIQASVEANKAIVLAELRAAMIDGTMEQDEMPPGVPPRSNKDHAAWSRMQFQDLHSGGYEPRRSRDFRPMGGGR